MSGLIKSLSNLISYRFNGRFAKFEHGLDLKRETDGVMATVLIYEAVNCRRRRTKNFVFNVWNNRLE